MTIHRTGQRAGRAKRLFTCICVLTCSLTLPLHADLFGGRYLIKIKRPLQTGMEFNSVITLESEAATKAQPRISPGTRAQKLELHCHVKVLNTRGGHWQQLEIIPSEVKQEPASKEMPTFKALNRTILVDRQKRKVTFTCRDSSKLLPFEVQILERFFVPPTDLNPDKAFGTAAQVKSGESWEINREETCKLLKATSRGTFNSTPDDISGTFSLGRVWNHLGQRYLQIGGTVRFNKITASTQKLQIPPGANVTAVLQLNYQIPLETSLPAVKMKEDFSWQLKGPHGILMTSRMVRNQTIEILKIPDPTGD